jgi:DNA-binding NarL/FixJ family response regulator
MSAFTITFALFDDHILRAHAFKRMLIAIDPLKFLFKASSKDVLISSLTKQKPNLLIVNHPFSDYTSVGIIESAREKNPALKIVVIANIFITDVIELINAGCNAVLPANIRPAEFQNAVLEIMKSEYYYNELFSKSMFAELKKRNIIKKDINSDIPITSQDVQLMNYLWLELTHKEIGERLDLKAKTIDTYVTNLIHKVDGKNVVGIIKYALKNKLISTEV